MHDKLLSRLGKIEFSSTCQSLHLGPHLPGCVCPTVCNTTIINFGPSSGDKGCFPFPSRQGLPFFLKFLFCLLLCGSQARDVDLRGAVSQSEALGQVPQMKFFDVKHASFARYMSRVRPYVRLECATCQLEMRRIIQRPALDLELPLRGLLLPVLAASISVTAKTSP